MDFSGSFWANHFEAGNHSALYAALESSSCELEELLEFDDFLQELRANAPLLVDFVSEVSSLKTLVALITEEPPEGASEARCYRLPFIANEALCLENEGLMKTFFTQLPQNIELLDSFWGFLDQPKPLNPVLAGYFNRSATAMFNKCPDMFCAYLQRNSDILGKLLDHLYSRSIAELLKGILCFGISEPTKAIFPFEGIITKLLKKLNVTTELSDDNSLREQADNLTMVLQSMFMLLKKELLQAHPVLCEMVWEENMAFLFDCVCSEKLWVVTAAVHILTVFINTACTNLLLSEWLEVGVPRDMQSANIELAKLTKSFYQHENAVDSSQELAFIANALFLDVYFVSKLENLGACLLVVPPENPSPLTDVVGLRTTQILKLFEAMLTSNSVIVADKLLETGLIEDIITLVFKHRWNNVLQLQFCKIFRLMLFRGLQNTKLLEALLTKTSFLVNALRCLRMHSRIRQCANVWKRRSKTLLLGGLFGHVLLLCNAIIDCSCISPWLKSFLNNLPAWEAVVKPELRFISNIVAKNYDYSISTEHPKCVTSSYEALDDSKEDMFLSMDDIEKQFSAFEVEFKNIKLEYCHTED